jgi:hypothetical protein
VVCPPGVSNLNVTVSDRPLPAVGVSVFKEHVLVRIEAQDEALTFPRGLHTLRVGLSLTKGSTSPGVHIRLAGSEAARVVPIPEHVKLWKPYFYAEYPTVVTVHPLALADDERLEDSLLGFVQRKFVERLKQSALVNGFLLGVPTARWALAGIAAVEHRSPTSLMYVVQRSPVVATRRFPFVTFFVPGMCLMNGCYAYEVGFVIGVLFQEKAWHTV